MDATGYVEITSTDRMRERLGDAIDDLYADAPLVGDPDLLDYVGAHRVAS